MQGGSDQSDEHLHKIIPLDGGLDLVTPRLLTEPGRLVDCLNYECVDQVGYKKIDGFERYDGGSTPSVADYWGISTTVSSMSLLGGFVEEESVIITYTDSTGKSREIGVTVKDISVVDGKWWLFFYPPYQSTLATATAATITDPVNGGIEAAYEVAGIVVTSTSSSLALALSGGETIRSTIDGLPGNVFPYGLQMYKDQMHVVGDCQYIYVVYDHTLTVPITSAAQFFPGNLFRNGAAGREGIILDYKFLFGDFGALSSAGTLAKSAVAKLLVRFTNNAALTTDTVLNIDRTTSTFASPMTYWKYISSLSGTGVNEDETPVWGGVLYKGLQENSTTYVARTSDNDWTQTDTGFEIGFKSGDSDIIPRELTLATTTAQLNNEIQTSVETIESEAASYSQVNMLAYQNSAASFPGATTDGGIALNGAYDLTTANTTGIYLTQSGLVWGDGTANTFKNFGFEIPEDVIITGITVTSRNFYNTASAANSIFFHTVKLTTPSGESYNMGGSMHTLDSGTHNTSAAAKSFTFGGANQKWGLSTLTPADVNSADFTLTMTPTVGFNGTAYLFWDVLTVTVHYFRPVGKLFFYNGSNEIEGKLVRIHLDKGSWAEGTAEGVAHVYGLATNATRNYVGSGESVRLISGGSTIAETTFVRASLLPSHTDIVDSDRRVQMLTANYFLNPDWETIYGCHGLGRAFSYDGTYFRKIYTAYDSELDKPRHIASYRNYLAMGYESGNVLLSKVGESGPEPENFQPLQGAREFSFVDRITGLTELVDTSLGVFCGSSINRIVLNPNASSASGLFYTSVISPNSGAIEYTVSTFGNMTLLCDQYGIRSVEQTDVYGDFIGRPVSFPVSPWLRPRLSAKKYWRDSRIAQRPLFAHTVRAKNQYRVWFDDGYILCMNMNTTEEPPRFTFLRYGFDFGATSFVPLTPIAHSRCVDSTGTERLHVAHWNRSSGTDAYENDTALFKYVFELERGWSFDGQDFPALLTLNLSFLETPYDYDQIRKVELHALDYNNTTLFAALGTKYGEEKSYSGMSFSSTYVPAGRNAAALLTTDYTPFAKMINVGNRGRPLYLKFKNASTATGDTSASAIEPPHILQALLVQYTPARQET